MPKWELAPVVEGDSEPEQAPAPVRRARGQAVSQAPVKITEQAAKYTLYSQARTDLDEMEGILAQHGPPGLANTILEGIKENPGGAGSLGGALTGAATGSRVGGAIGGPVGIAIGAAGGAAIGGGLGYSEPFIRPMANYLQGAASQRYFAAAGRVKDSLEKAMTGAASSERETLQYAHTLIPQYGDDPQTTLSKIQALRLRLHTLEALGRGQFPENVPEEDRPLPTLPQSQSYQNQYLGNIARQSPTIPWPTGD